MGHLDVSD